MDEFILEAIRTSRGQLKDVGNPACEGPRDWAILDIVVIWERCGCQDETCFRVGE